MANAAPFPCRLCLVTPGDYAVDTLSPKLSAALGAGDIASLVITAPARDPAALRHAANAFVPIAVAHGTAALIHNDARIAAYSKADGLHLDSAEALADAGARRHGDGILGIGNLGSRHAAMEAGEMNPDYVFFGRLDGDSAAEIHPNALDLAAWWSALTVIPAMVMGGRDLASVSEAAAAGVPFVALSRAVWDHADGPAAAVRQALEHLTQAEETVA